MVTLVYNHYSTTQNAWNGAQSIGPGNVPSVALEDDGLCVVVWIDGHEIKEYICGAPVAEFSYSGNVVNQWITFDASLSRDDDGQIVLYEWDFDSDGIIDSNNVSHNIQFTRLGPIDVTLKVTDDDNRSNSITITIHVTDGIQNERPMASFTTGTQVPSTGNLTRVNVDASASSDADGTITDYLWDINDDGTFEVVTSDPQATLYMPVGLTPLRLVVVDDDLARGEAISTVNVSGINGGAPELIVRINGGPGAGSVTSDELIPNIDCVNSSEPTTECRSPYREDSEILLTAVSFKTNPTYTWLGCDSEGLIPAPGIGSYCRISFFWDNRRYSYDDG